MIHRTYGDTKNCEGCRYWSERMARSEGPLIVAVCINSDSPESGKYKSGSDGCDSYASGHYGAIDSPGESEEIIKLYDEEDADENGQVGEVN